jgi:hypothetical protein
VVRVVRANRNLLVTAIFVGWRPVRAVKRLEDVLVRWPKSSLVQDAVRGHWSFMKCQLNCSNMHDDAVLVIVVGTEVVDRSILTWFTCHGAVLQPTGCLGAPPAVVKGGCPGGKKVPNVELDVNTTLPS